MQWTKVDSDQVRRQGFALLPPLAPDLVARAKKMIDDDFAAYPPHSQADWDWARDNTFCAQLADTHALDFLCFDSGAFEFAEGALGPLSRSVTAQIARRRQGNLGRPHIDGFYPKDQEPADTPDAVLGIYLTDVLAADDGAFETWPDQRAMVKSWARNFRGTPPRATPEIEIANPEDGRALLGPKGTAFLVHGALPHRNAMRKTATGYRDAVFFRFYRLPPKRDVLALLQSGAAGW